MTDLDKATVEVAHVALKVNPEFRIIFERLTRMLDSHAQNWIAPGTAGVVPRVLVDLNDARALLHAILNRRGGGPQ